MKILKEVRPSTFAGRKAVIVVFREKEESETEEIVKEIMSLSTTLGLRITKKFIYRPDIIHPATYIGKGRLDEIKEYTNREKTDFLIFSNELTPVQQRNIETYIKIRVIDRTELILHIFGEHAKSKEGKIQVELAQLSYILPRLTGYGISLSRIGGGLGIKGPGEMKLEVYRRRIKERIHRLKQEIREIEKHRELIRTARKRKNFPVVSVIGYTNVGKTSIINKLSSSELYVANKLFSTLDPATRGVYLGDNRICLLIDTVGLLYNIPHHMIEAFKSTLEEVTFADLILCVYDISSPNMERQYNTVTEVLKLLSCEDKVKIDVYNKIDLLNPEDINILKSRYTDAVFISAYKGEGIEILKERLKEELYGSTVRI
ncbi:MAG: GTPase HflX [Candidatus Ratteibacteria bacterium]|nr:GTPase HflX [Candidatus Ratteibacteria bacterium]